MRIVHTADWHLGDRLGRIDRAEDIRRAVERVAGYCKAERADVLLIAGDLFSELSRNDGLRESIEHLRATFEPFLLGGGTILAITGNHDNETFCQTLRLMMDLAAPAAEPTETVCPPGRLYLATSPTLLRLGDRDGPPLPFLLMPYPTPARYLGNGQMPRYHCLEEKNKHLQTAFAVRLRALQDAPAFPRGQPVVLAAHIHLQNAVLPSLFRISEQENIVVDPDQLPVNLAYGALGHIHHPQRLPGREQVRYAGSIERLDLGEQHDEKGVVVFDVTSAGLQGEPRWLPLPATPIYRIDLQDPRAELPRLREKYPQAQRDLVQLHFTFDSGKDNLESILRELEIIFPRWYARDWTDAAALGPALTIEEASRTKSFEDTVRDYLEQELTNDTEEDRAALLERALRLIRQVQ
jgi:exonuclease SbcD